MRAVSAMTSALNGGPTGRMIPDATAGAIQPIISTGMATSLFGERPGDWSVPARNAPASSLGRQAIQSPAGGNKDQGDEYQRHQRVHVVQQAEQVAQQPDEPLRRRLR